MRISEARLHGRRLLAAKGIESASLDASLLLEKVTGMSRTALIVHDDEALSDGQEREFLSLIERRATGYPLAYILGFRDFWGLRLQVTEDTLIPRPATETLVEEALKLPFGNALDLGCGSGAIILALKSERPDAECTAVDFSAGALKTAASNAAVLGLDVRFYQGSWFDPVGDERFDLIVSNPPYIEDDDPHLSETSLPFEPVTALTSGADGLDDLRIIVAEAPLHLQHGGHLLCEHGYDQGERVRALFAKAGFAGVSTVCDLEGCERVTMGMLP